METAAAKDAWVEGQCMPLAPCAAIHASTRYTTLDNAIQRYTTLYNAIQRHTLSRVHPLALAAGRCRTTGGRAATTWRTWRSGRSCWPTCGGRRLSSRSCCAGGSTRGDR
eukprot:scaffold9046_cov64-Phaeocystis_antarctica.AAC.4